MSDPYNQDADPNAVADQIEGHHFRPMDNTRQTIWKTAIDLDGGTTEIPLPAAATVLSVQLDKATGKPTVWYQLDPEASKVRTLELQVVITGGGVPNAEFLATFQMDDTNGENFVGHVYYRWL